MLSGHLTLFLHDAPENFYWEAGHETVGEACADTVVFLLLQCMLIIGTSYNQ